MMTKSLSPRLWIGTAAWAIPKDVRESFGTGSSVLERYSTRLNLVEINSSFYRAHQRKTYERWAATVPDHFRFSVKMPKAITHELALKHPAPLLEPFMDQCGGLGAKLGAVLVQLPPSLVFDARIANAFFDQLRALAPGMRIVLEPRHASWITPAAMRTLCRHAISRVNADPSPFDEAAPETQDPTYWRLHGSPCVYRSAYPQSFLRRLAQHLLDPGQDRHRFVVFDNTTEGHATPNALALVSLLGK